MNMGHKYCIRFSEEKFQEKFTENGKKIIDHINKCLPNSTKKIYTKSRAINCDSLNDNAFKMQQKCYETILNDFCIGFSENKKLFLNSIDTSDLANSASLSMMLTVIGKCKNPTINIFSLLNELSSGNSK